MTRCHLIEYTLVKYYDGIDEDSDSGYGDKTNLILGAMDLSAPN